MLLILLRRLGQAVLVLFIVALISFLIFRYVGSPVDNLLAQEATVQQRADLEEALGLNTSKKTEVVEYIAGLFAEPFATLSDAQREAVQHWCPEHMQTAIRTADESATQAA